MKEKDTEFIQHTANNLKAIRTNTGVSREAIAEHLGMSESAYGYLETGRTELTVSRLKGIADFLKTSMSKILGESTDVMNRLDAMMEEIKEYRNKPKSKKDESK